MEVSMIDSPVKFSIDYPEKLSRGKLLLKTFFGWLYVGIPHGIILIFYGIAVSVVTFIAWWVILFTAKYPKGMFNFVIRYWRWDIRVSAYLSLLTDAYPPFSGDELDTPVKFLIEYPENLSRGKLLLKTFFGWLYVGIPHGIILIFYGIAVSVVTFIAWWVILFTAKYPKGMFNFVIRYWRWDIRVSAYLGLLTDAYPPFNGEE